MCTNLHRSAYEIMRRFDTIRPKSKETVYKELLKARAKMILGATTSIEEYIDTLYTEMDLAKKGHGYVLTPVGRRERDRLEKIVKKAPRQRLAHNEV